MPWQYSFPSLKFITAPPITMELSEFDVVKAVAQMTSRKTGKYMGTEVGNVIVSPEVEAKRNTKILSSAHLL